MKFFDKSFAETLENEIKILEIPKFRTQNHYLRLFSGFSYEYKIIELIKEALLTKDENKGLLNAVSATIQATDISSSENLLYLKKVFQSYYTSFEDKLQN